MPCVLLIRSKAGAETFNDEDDMLRSLMPRTVSN